MTTTRTAPSQAVNQPVPLTAHDLLATGVGREFLLIGGKDGVGKTSALVSIAMVVNGKVDDLEEGCVRYIDPSAKVYVLDTEHKYASVFRQFGRNTPENVVYYYCQNMESFLAAFDRVMRDVRPGDWVHVESAARLWEHSQDLAYREVSGLSKAEYLARRRAERAADKNKATSPIPQPDDFWKIAKNAHDGMFLSALVARDDINVAMTTIIVKPPRDAPNRKENVDRKEIRLEYGLDAGLGGTPTLPYQPETLVLLDRDHGVVRAKVLRDNNSALDDGRVDFVVEDKKDFGPAWMRNCRVPEDEE